MAKQLQIRGGTTVQHSTFTGALREITIDTDKDVVVVHDGTTVGGFPLAKQATVDTKVDKVTSTDNAIVRFNGTTGDVQNSGVVIDDNNNIGIGTSSPSGFGKLAVKGQIAPVSPDEISQGVFAVDNTGKVTVGGYNSSGTNYLSFTAGGGNERMRIDSAGNVLLTSGTGGLGYGTGAGGTVTQLTSKSTAVVLNKPTGTIITHNATMVSGAAVSFSVINTLVSNTDTVVPSTSTTSYAYTIDCVGVANGSFIIRIVNNAASSLSENIAINFTIIKGANA